MSDGAARASGAGDARWSARATALAVALGALLLTIQFLGRLSLHTDEAAIALNLRARALAALLTHPLDYAQMAPPGWLALEWLALRLAGPSEYALRALPFAASLVALGLTAVLARRVAGGIVPVLAVTWLATFWEFLFYGTQAKQYGVDVAVALALVLQAHRALDEDAVPRWRDGLLGALAISASQAGAFVATALGAALVVGALGSGWRARAWRLAPLLLPWGVAAAAVAAWTLSLTTPALSAYMTRFWEYTFARWPLRPVATVRWAWDALRGALLAPLALGWGTTLPKVYALAFAAGVLVTLRTHWRRALLLLAPIAGAYALAAAHRYPIGGRVTLYLVPLVLVLLARGTDALARALARPLAARVPRAPDVAAVALAAAFAAPAVTLALREPPPAWLDNTRPLIAAVARAVRPGDVIYLHHSIAKPFDWYWPQLAHADVRIRRGRCVSGDPRPALAEVEALRGEPRLWVVTADTTWNGYPMVARFVAGLAPARDSVVTTEAPSRTPPTRAVAYRRDFADPVAIAAVRADTVTIPAAYPITWMGWTCFGSEPQPVLHPSLWR